MTFLKRTFFFTLGLVLMIMVSACGDATTTGSTPAPTTAPAATPTPAASTAVVQTAQATVAGKSMTILTDAKGMTLYYFTADAPGKLSCTGGCAQAWPPLLSTASDTPTSATSLPGQLTVFKNANGSQVEYGGYLLYTYVKDTAPGQTTGQGVGDKWFVATPDIASFVIRTSSATVGGKTEAILTDAKGMTLYYFTPDSPTTVTCTGGCATNWPPLKANGSSAPQADAPLTGKLTALASSGNQVEYNGHPLYTFVTDTAPGQTTGQGVGGKWFVATPTLAAA